MTQLQRMDARLGTLSTKLYQVNIRVSYIARQAVMGGFILEASPPPPRADSEDEDDDDDDDDAIASEDDGDGDASSSGIDERSS